MLSQSSVQSIYSILREELSFLNSIRYIQRGVISRLDHLAIPNTRYGLIHFQSLNKYKASEKRDRSRFLRLSDTAYNLKKTARWGVTVYNTQDLQRALQYLRTKAHDYEETIGFSKMSLALLKTLDESHFDEGEYETLVRISRKNLYMARDKNKRVTKLIKEIKKELKSRS